MSLVFIKTASAGAPADFLSRKIMERLAQGQRVLWLASGGSAITVAVNAARQLEAANLQNLAFSLIDERYGPPGHPDSNWAQLVNAGFNLKGANLYAILNGADAANTLKQYSDFLGGQLRQADYKIGLLGIGADGHTAGILPNSPAVEAHGPASYYEAPQYQRITITPEGLLGLDEAVVYAQGQSKWKALDQLSQDLPLAYQPAQIIKKIPLVTIFNEYKGDGL